MKTIIMLLCALSVATLRTHAYAADYSSTRYSPDSKEDKVLFFTSEQGSFQLKTTTTGYSPKNVPTFFAPFFNKSDDSNGKLPASVVEILISADIDNQIEELTEVVKDLSAELADQQEEVSDSGHDDQSFKLMSKLKKDVNRKKQELKKLEDEKASLGSKRLERISSFISASPSRDLIIKDGADYLRIRTVRSEVNVGFKIPGRSIRAEQTDFLIEKKVNGTSFEESSFSDPVFAKVYKKDGTLVGIEFKGVLARLHKIEDQNLKRFREFLSKHPVEVNSFNFKGQTLFTRYVTTDSNLDEKMSLELDFSETGKSKNLVLVKAAAPTKLFDPESSSFENEKHLGVLVSTKSEKLLQVKKVKKRGGKEDDAWAFNLKSQMITLGNQAVIVSKELYYGYEGLWYLAYWMNERGVDQRKVFLVNGTSPIALTVTRTGGEIIVSKEGQDLFRYKFNSRGFIGSFQFVPEDQTLRLASVETTTTRANKKLISDFMKNNGIEQL